MDSLLINLSKLTDVQAMALIILVVVIAFVAPKKLMHFWHERHPKNGNGNGGNNGGGKEDMGQRVARLEEQFKGVSDRITAHDQKNDSDFAKVNENIGNVRCDIRDLRADLRAQFGNKKDK